MPDAEVCGAESAAFLDTKEDTLNDIREERQVEIDARIIAKRAKADKLQAAADRIAEANQFDYAFWTQPAYGNAAGRAFARKRDRARASRQKAGEMAGEARKLREQADRMERQGAVVAGDAAAERAAVIAAVKVEVGQMVNTTFYGVRKVLKVNRVSVLVEGASPFKVNKEFISAVRS